MAFRDKKNAMPDEPMWRNGVINVTFAVGNKEVGTGAPAMNEPTDMMLVYYFIYYLYRFGNHNVFKPHGDLSRPELLPAAKDYRSADFKIALASNIMQCQKDMIKNGKRVFPDGRCDRSRQPLTSVTHSSYTIDLLNIYYALLIKKTKGTDDWQEFLANDPLAPSLLRWELAFMNVINV